MSERNLAAVRGYLERLAGGTDWERWGEFMGDSVQFNGQPVDRDYFRAMVDYLRGVLPDLGLEIVEMIADGDRVATRVTFTGTHEGEFDGIAPTGCRVSFLGLTLDRLENAKVVEMWHELDMFGMLMQIRAAASGRE